MNFVSEKELRKQEENNPEASSEEPVDKRPLYHRLKEVRDKQQLERDETNALRNQFCSTRGMDEGEADFLSQIDKAKEEQELRKKKEEQELLKLAREQGSSQQNELADQPQPSLDRPQKAPKHTIGKQASLVSTLVRKRAHSSTGEESLSAKSSVGKQPPAKQRGHCVRVALLPGITGYSDSSDEAESSSNSESLESELPIVAVYAGKGTDKGQKEIKG